MTTPVTDLPKIGPAAVLQQFPVNGDGYVDPEWNRLYDLKIEGNAWEGDLASVTTSATMSFSAGQIGQLSVTLADSWDGAIIGAGLIRKGTTIDWRNQHCLVTGMSVRPGPGGPVLTVRARSRVVDYLSGEKNRGKGVWDEQDYADWLIARAKEGGATWFIQPGMGRLTLARTADDDTTWAAATRGAQQVGAWLMEYENKIVSGRPSWLASTERSRVWDIEYYSPDNYTNGLVGQPSWDWSDGSPETLAFGLVSADAETIRPGERVIMKGNMGLATGDWIVTQVDIPARITAPVTVSCARIVDPAPQLMGTAA